MNTAGVSYIELRAKLDQFQRDLEAAGKQAGDAGQKASKSFSQKLSAGSKKLSDVGNKMSTRLTLPIVAAGGLIVDAASDMSESLSKANVVFGDSADAIAEWSKSAAESMGISRQEALEAAGTFGNLFTAMDIGDKPASDMSKNLVQLASDLASFNNADPTEVLVNLRAGLMGEAEPLRKFGVQLSAARIQQEALNMGLADSAEELTAADKAQAAYQIMLQDTETAQGDFARTSDGVANQQRILKARFKDTAATLGTTLLPVAERLLKWIGNVASAFQSLSPRTRKFILLAAGLAAALGPVLSIVGNLGRALIFLQAHPVALVITAIAALVAGLIVAYNKSETFRNAVQDLVKAGKDLYEAVRPLIAQIGTALKEAFAAIAPILRSVVIPALSAFIGHLANIIRLIAKAISALSDLGSKFSGAGGVIGGAIKSVVPGGGLIDILNGGVGAGNLGGGLLSLGQTLQGQGFRVGGHPSFGGVTQGAHSAGSYHYVGRAIDINWGAGGTSAEEMDVLTGLGMKLQAVYGSKLLELLGPWNDANHKDHLHVAMDTGGWVKGPATVHVGNIREKVHFTPENQRSVTIIVNGGNLREIERIMEKYVGRMNRWEDRMAAR